MNAIEPLRQDQIDRLIQLESVIEHGLGDFVKVGSALLDIRQEKLYRREHKTFEDYCKIRWSFGRAHLYRLMDAAHVLENVSRGRQNDLENVSNLETKPNDLENVSNLETKPNCEAQCRELKQLPPADQAPAFAEATEAANGHPTAADVRKVVRKRKALAAGEAPAEVPVTSEQAAEAEKLMRDHIFRTDLANIEDEIEIILRKFSDRRAELVKFLASQLRKAKDFEN